MFRKVAIALVAASMLTAPVMAKAPAAKPATASTSSTTVKTVKADKTVLKHHKHARAHRNVRLSRHQHREGVKYAHHFHGGKGHKVAGTSGKVVSAKPATRSN